MQIYVKMFRALNIFAYNLFNTLSIFSHNLFSALNNLTTAT